MHPIQKLLLSRLVKTSVLTYGNLTRGHDAEDNVLYHLNRLLQAGYVSKEEKGQYRLTTKGLRASTRFTQTDLEENQWKMGWFSFVAKFDDEFLIRRRILGESQFSKLPGAKPQNGVPQGESLQDTFALESGLELSTERFQYNSTHTKIQRTSTGDVLFDDIMLVYNVELNREEHSKSNPRDHTEWISRSVLAGLPNLWPEIDLCILNPQGKRYYTYEFVNDYNLSD